MNGRFFIGVLSGAVLVSGAFIVGSVMFPVDNGTPPIEIANTSQAPKPVAEPAPEPEPEPAPEPEPEPAPEPVPAPEPAPEPEPVPEPVPAPEPVPEPAPETASVAEKAATVEPAPAPEADATPADTAGVSATAPAVLDALPEAEPPPALAATEPAAEAAPESPTLAEAATPPATPAVLDPPQADPAKLPDATATPPTPVAAAPADAPAVAAAPDPAPAAEAEPTVELAEVAPEPAPAVKPLPAPEPAPSEPQAETEAAPEAADPVEPDPTPEVPAAEPLPQADGMVPGADAPAAPEAEPEQDAPDVGTLPADEGLDPSDSTFEPASGLGSAAEGVIVGRLPRIGDAPADEAAAADPAADPDEAVATTPEADLRPVAQFAATFENIDAKPVMAIVLIDPGTADLDRAGLAALPFSVSFALDPQDPATPDRVAIYREAGKEVVMLATGIAVGAQASDIEVAFQSMAQSLPEAVAVMDLAEPLFQDRRPLASLVVPVVGAQGRGLLTWDRGLNAADQVARRNDVPAAVVFRDLGAAGTDSGSIRRVLDRAVFKAGQDGRVAVAGTASPDLIAALLEWTVEGRAATVALAPLTAVLTVE